MASNVRFVTVLPVTLLPSTVYHVKDADGIHYKTYVTDKDGVKSYSPLAGADALDISRYDLPFAVTTTTMDLSTNQVFKVDLTQGGTVTLTFTNAPANTRSMVIVLETSGAASTLVLPSNLTVADGVDTAPGSVNSVYTILFDGTRYILMNNTKVVS